MSIYGFRKVFIIFCLALLSVTSCSENLQSERLFKCSDRLNNAYGIVAHVGFGFPNNEKRDSTMNSISDIGVNFIRTDFYWQLIQPTSSHEKRYSHLDCLMGYFSNKKLKLLPILDYSIKEYADIWNHVDRWGDYVDGVVGRYGNKIRYWEIWNEENASSFWPPEPSVVQYLCILNKAASIIQHRVHGSKIVMGGLSGIDIQYMEDIIAHDGLKNVDVVNIHYYDLYEEPERMARLLYKLSKVLDKHGVRKEVWLTETGYSTFPKYKEKYIDQVSEECQAQGLPRTFLTAFSYGIDKVFWYCHMTDEQRSNREDFFGLVHNDLTPKPAYFAYKTLIQMCPDRSIRPTLSQKGNIYSSMWKRPDGKKVWAFWTSGNTETVVMTIKGKYHAYDIYGKEIPEYGDKNVKITPSIVYIVGAKDLRMN